MDERTPSSSVRGARRRVVWNERSTRRMKPTADNDAGLVREPPRDSAAVAGIVYSLTAAGALLLLRAVPGPSSTEAQWLEWIAGSDNRRNLVLGLNLASLSAVAFLWFVAVVRRRVGDREDRFFATVFMGSAFVYVGIWITAASIVAAPAVLHSLDDTVLLDWETYRLAEGTAASILLVAGPRIQAVFVASTSTVFLRARVVPNWLAYLGYAVAGVMFAVPIVSEPVGLGLPAFVLVSSITILATRRRSVSPGEQTTDQL